MKKFIRWLLLPITGYLILCLGIYAKQELLLFHPTKLDATHTFQLNVPFEEIYFPMKDGTKIHGLLCKSDKPKGLIFYLHGNGGSNDSWSQIAKTYTTRNYDILFLDYRGYGKSEGEIENETQLHEDVQIAYNFIKTRYSETDIIILGYSIGTGLASKLASSNHPKLLILQAPYVSMLDLKQHRLPFVPDILLRYPLRTDLCLPNCQIPIVIFHGTKDETIYHESSDKLKASNLKRIQLFKLENQGHNNMSDHPKYQDVLDSLLKH